MLFGGRVAEEMIFGVDEVTTGAGNDIERATSMARRMVTSFGMSEVIGLMAVGDSEQEVFLGRELGHRRQVSEHTAQQVDQEVKRLLDEAHASAQRVLEQHEDLLESIAQALLERETIDQEDLRLLSEGKALPPPEVAAEPLLEASNDDEERPPARPAPRPEGGLMPPPHPATGD